ncbi:MAG: GNAT family N-acetyltransferase, partial [Methylocella sp.]
MPRPNQPAHTGLETFWTIDAGAKIHAPGAARYEAGIWSERNSAIVFRLGRDFFETGFYNMSMDHAKAINYPALNGAGARKQSIRRAEVRIARGFDDLLMVYSVRSAVYIAEQECPFAEEFDGNDHCATHFIGFIKGEPAGCIRARFFHDFVKLERLAVLKRFRKSTLAYELVRSGIDL